MNFTVIYGTDVGIKKKTNQDALLIKEGIFQNERVLFVAVCDGMGGLAKGEVASAEVIRRLSDWFEYELSELLKEDFQCADLEEQLNILVLQENDKIAAYGKKNGLSLGTTLTGMLIWKENYYIIHVGDGRAYELSDKLYQLTEDQTVVAKEVAAGRLTEAEAEQDARRSILLQCIGASEILNPAFYFGSVPKNSMYLLCSDGFRHELGPSEMWNSFTGMKGQGKAEMKAEVDTVIELIKQRGEKDNISCLLVRIEE